MQREKSEPSLLSYFKTLSIGPVSGIEPATSHSAVTRLACFRLSDSGADAKEKGSRKVLFSCLRFLNSADPTISEPGTGYHTLY